MIEGVWASLLSLLGSLWRGCGGSAGAGVGGSGVLGGSRANEGAGVWDHKANTVIKDTIKDRGKGCPWARDRFRDHHHGKEKRHGDLGDLEWVGGWEHLHL